LSFASSRRRIVRKRQNGSILGQFVMDFWQKEWIKIAENIK
jgi:hypothetical protein